MAFDFGNFWFTVGGIIIIIFFFAYLWLSSRFTYSIRIKDIVKGRRLIHDHKAKMWTDKDKTAWLKISGEKNKERKLLSLPPEECIDLNKKGKKYAECYRLESGEIIWIKDDCNIQTPPTFDIPKEIQDKIDAEKDGQKKKELADSYKKQQLEEWRKKYGIITPFQPITTNQRAGYFNNWRKAEERKGFDWKNNIIPIASIGAVTIIVLALLLFYGEIAKPMLQANAQAIDMKKMNNEQLELMNQNLELLRDIKMNVQRITTNQIPPPQEIPGENDG